MKYVHLGQSLAADEQVIRVIWIYRDCGLGQWVGRLIASKVDVAGRVSDQCALRIIELTDASAGGDALV